MCYIFRYVIDCGKEKQMQYDAEKHISSLVEQQIAKVYSSFLLINLFIYLYIYIFIFIYISISLSLSPSSPQPPSVQGVQGAPSVACATISTQRRLWRICVTIRCLRCSVCPSSSSVFRWWLSGVSAT